MKKYPFKFLDAYSSEDKGIFFGRDEEINALYEMVFQSSIILIYGASGTGKTSLINCGLAGKFQQHDWLPLMIRRGININESLEKALKNAGGSYTKIENEINWDDDFSNDLSQYLKPDSPIGNAIKSIYQKSFRPIYLVFDQFEELFILGTKTEQELFVKAILDILQSKQPVKIIFSIREEYLGFLFDFERAIPQLMKKKLRIEAMNLEKVKQVIVGASQLENSNIRIKKGESDGVSEGIFNKVRGKGKSLTIQLPFLQVFLDKFYLKCTGDESRNADAVFSMKILNEMGEIGDILIDFLEEQVNGISKNLSTKYPILNPEMIWRILSPFSTLEGTKEPISKQELLDRLPELNSFILDAVVDAFILSRILRYNENTEMFEISHDALAKPIAEKRSVEEKALLEIKRLIKSQVSVNDEAREYFTEKQLLFIDPYLDKFKLKDDELNWIDKSRTYVNSQKELIIQQKIEEHKQKRKVRQKWLSIVGFIVFIALIVSTIFAINLKQNLIKVEEKKVELIKANEYANELLKLVMSGRGDKYESQTDSILKNILRIEQTYPIDSLITPRAAITKFRVGGTDFRNFVLWIDVPSFRKNEIKEVHYNFCKGFLNPERISKEPSSSFSIGYLGWGYCPTIDIDIILKTGDTIKQNFSFDNYFKNYPDEE